MITAGTIVATSHYQVQIDTELTNRDTSPNANPKLSYEITISLFDYGGDQKTHTILASSASSPGLCGGYAVGDIVIVGFFQNDFDQAVILGKVDYDKAAIAEACAVRTNKLILTENGKADLPLTYDQLFKLKQLLNNTQI